MAFVSDFLLGLQLSLRARFVSIFFILIITLCVATLLAAQFSARQPQTVALDVGISVIRFSLPLFVILMVQELFTREFERKLHLRSFTYPRARLYWLLGRVSAILLLAGGLLVGMGLILAAMAILAAGSYEQTTPVGLGFPYLVTLSFVAVDLLVVVAIATLLAISAATPSFVLIGTIGFVLIARSYTPIMDLLRNSPYVVNQFADPGLYKDSLGLLAFLMPDLGRLDVRMIALYDQMRFLPSDWPLLVGATLIYVVSLLALTSWVLNKREFN